MTYTVTLEMFVNGAWLDITRLDANTRLLSLDEGQRGVVITRGRMNTQERVPASGLQIDYLDSNATLDWDNPLSVYYRKIGHGTPLRVKVDGEIRLWAKLSALNPNWDESPDVVKSELLGAGIFGQLGTGQKPLESALTRYFGRESPWQWWRLEEGPGQQVISIESSISGRAPLRASHATAGSTNARTSGVVSGGDTEGPDGASGAVDVSSGGQLTASLPLYGPSLGLDRLIVEGAFQFSTPVDDVSGSGHIVSIGSGGGYLASLFALPESLSVGTVIFELFSDSGESISRTTSSIIVDDGSWHWVTIDFTRDTAITFDYVVTIDGEQMWSGTTTSTALLDPTDFTLSRSGELGAVSQWAIWKDDYLPDDVDGGYDAFTGHAEETPVERVTRLCSEEGIDLLIQGADYGNIRMGPQTQSKFLDLLQEADRVEGGVLYEHRTLGDKVVFKTRSYLYNQPPSNGATLTYDQLGKPFRPTNEDDGIANDISGGSSEGLEARYVIPDGDVLHWSTESPPTGAGVRDQADSWNTYEQSDLDSLTAWTAHILAWRGKKFANVSLNLARSEFDSATRAAVRTLDIGAPIYASTVGAPPHVPYNEQRMMVQGYTETITKFEHKFDFNTTSLDIYEVDVVDSGDTSTLAMPIDSNDTTIRIQPGLGRAWSESDEPYHIQVAGEPMTVTTITTDTPAFISGSVATSGDNASVTPSMPAGITPDVGQLLLVWAAIRNSGTGTVDLHPDYENIVEFGNTRLMGRYYRTGDTAPTITFTGGVAGATTSAVMVAFSGLSMAIASGTKRTPAASTQLNGSAQDIAYPAVTLPALRTGVELLALWKQDDHSSTGIPAGYSNGISTSTTTGDDQSLVVQYDLTAASHGTGTNTITGGAAAISRAVAVILRPLQTATVTRNIAGVAASRSIGNAIHAWRPGVNGL